MTDPYNREFTFTHDWAGGVTLANTVTRQDVYFQPGDDAGDIDARYDRLVGDCGYDGQSALAILWGDYADIAKAKGE